MKKFQGDVDIVDILCLMGLFPDEYRGEIEKNSKTGMQNAADKLQWLLINGLDELDDANVTIANSLYIGAYPRLYRKMKIPTFEFHHSSDADDINIGFCNLIGVKWFSRYLGIKKVVKKWAETESESPKVLLIYALTTPFANIAKYIKKKYPHVKVCIVVPDLPDYMNVAEMNKKGLYYFLKNIEIGMIRKCIDAVDCYVLLTDAMREWFGKSIKYTVVEGIASGIPNDLSISPKIKKEKKILYAGGIKAEYGVIDMAEAFAKVNHPDWELVIYGDGSDMELLKNVAAGHSNIVLKGRVPNSEVLEAQKNASILINPRKNQIFTKYSFPSKIMEYMSSGTPIMAYKLDGIPEEYDPFYFRIDDAEDGLVNSFNEIMNLSDQELVQMGERAKEFVSKHKNAKVQCQKIIDMIEHL